MQRWIVLPDPQIPHHDKRSFAAVEKYIAAHKWDGWLCLGDFLDFNEISTHSEGKRGAVTERVDKTFAAGRKLLKRHVRLIRDKNPGARMVLLEGNHDYRAVDYTERHHEVGNTTFDVPTNLHLKELGVEWVPSWSKGKVFKLGKAHFIHGLLTSKYHAALMAARYGVCIYYGHTHDIMEFPIVMRGENKTIVGKSLGCLCKYDQAYLKGAPTNWQQGVSTFFIRPNGYYSEYTSRIFNHSFVGPDGVTYSG